MPSTISLTWLPRREVLREQTPEIMILGVKKLKLVILGPKRLGTIAFLARGPKSGNNRGALFPKSRS